MSERSRFADYVDRQGLYVRQWAYGSGHRPLMETREGPEGFEPPFGSGAVLTMVALGDDGVAVYAESAEAWQRATMEVVLWRVEHGV